MGVNHHFISPLRVNPQVDRRAVALAAQQEFRRAVVQLHLRGEGGARGGGGWVEEGIHISMDLSICKSMYLAS